MDKVSFSALRLYTNKLERYTTDNKYVTCIIIRAKDTPDLPKRKSFSCLFGTLPNYVSLKLMIKIVTDLHVVPA
jgi:hypothetical protein